MIIRRYTLIMTLVLFGVMAANAQIRQTSSETDKYTQTITERSNKIVATLGITDSMKFIKVRNLLVEQYRSLSSVHDAENARVKEIKAHAGNDKAAANLKIAAIDSTVSAQLNKLHVAYMANLGQELDARQIDKVKNGMTYNIMPITYAAYLDELPELTTLQKAQIMTWLLEAREHAIDAGSSEKKHAWFGKYKGRINNYLSAQGYDMKKAGEEWQQRIRIKNSR